VFFADLRLPRKLGKITNKYQNQDVQKRKNQKITSWKIRHAAAGRKSGKRGKKQDIRSQTGKIVETKLKIATCGCRRSKNIYYIGYHEIIFLQQ